MHSSAVHHSVCSGGHLLDRHGGWVLSSSVVLFSGDVATNEIGEGGGLRTAPRNIKARASPRHHHQDKECFCNSLRLFAPRKRLQAKHSNRRITPISHTTFPAPWIVVRTLNKQSLTNFLPGKIEKEGTSLGHKQHLVECLVES